MATQKEIALLGAFSMGCTFKNGMKIVHMPADDINAQTVKHVCMELRGFSFLQPIETIVQDHLTYWIVRVWSCPYCGKLYWFTSEAGRLFGEQAIIHNQQKKFMQMRGMDTRMVPPESFYAVLMTDEDDTNMNYNPSFDSLDTDSSATNLSYINGLDQANIFDQYNPQTNQAPINLDALDPMKSSSSSKQIAKKQELEHVQSQFDDIDW